ncbi:MAG: GNAT family N-acetyltransferase [Treponema sp.]|jgi:GNAT superfamily N-acetyltransferase|nr:GNAT family N-acetyltransferase [Treponema sp.]
MGNIKECSVADVETLAELNKMLIEDEKADNKMNMAQLKERMKDFLEKGYKAYYFLKDNGDITGYALCDFNKDPLYLRQFFIKREERRKKLGKEFFKRLVEHTERKDIEIDVYEWNEAGKSFWESVGFEKKYMHMVYRET